MHLCAPQPTPCFPVRANHDVGQGAFGPSAATLNAAHLLSVPVMMSPARGREQFRRRYTRRCCLRIQTHTAYSLYLWPPKQRPSGPKTIATSPLSCARKSRRPASAHTMRTRPKVLRLRHNKNISLDFNTFTPPPWQNKRLAAMIWILGDGGVLHNPPSRHHERYRVYFNASGALARRPR
jgi:hypothetical protein